MIEGLRGWAAAAAGAGMLSALVTVLCPEGGRGFDRFVRLVASLCVISVIIKPVFSFFSGVADIAAPDGIFEENRNININGVGKADEWILSQTLDSLEDGIEKLCLRRFGVKIEAKAVHDPTERGVIINSVRIRSGTVYYARMAQIADYLSDYLNVPVEIESDERIDRTP